MLRADGEQTIGDASSRPLLEQTIPAEFSSPNLFNKHHMMDVQYLVHIIVFGEGISRFTKI